MTIEISAVIIFLTSYWLKGIFNLSTNMFIGLLALLTFMVYQKLN